MATKIKSKEKMQDYITKVKSIASLLGAIEKPVPKIELYHTLLNSIPSKFSHLVVTLDG